MMHTAYKTMIKNSEFEESDLYEMNACYADGAQYAEKSISLVGNILEKTVLGISKASKESTFNRATISLSSQYINQLIRRTMPMYKLRKSKLPRLSSSHNSIPYVSPVDGRRRCRI